MPSSDDRVGESPNEINAEAWLPFLLYTLSSDTPCVQHIQQDISGELVARFQPRSKPFISLQKEIWKIFKMII